MFIIGICTECENFENYIKAILKEWLIEYPESEMLLVPFANLLEMEQEFQILLFDKQLLLEKGFSALDLFARNCPETLILFVERQEEQGILGARYHLFAYQFKRLKRRDWHQLIQQRFRKYFVAPRCLSIEMDGKKRMIPLNEIIYIESANRKIVLHTRQGNYEYYEKMYVLEELLSSDDFVRCHQSYIVAKQAIVDYNSTEIVLEQEILPIGRKYKKQVYKELGVSEYSTGLQEEAVTEKQGVLCGVTDDVCETVIQFRPDQKILIGRDEKVADIVLAAPKVSRLHCVVVYHELDNMYELLDVSKNGVFLEDGQRLAKDTTYQLKPGTKLCFGDKEVVYCLG